MTTLEWADEYRYLAKSASANSGKFKSSLTPWMWGVYDALDDPKIPFIVGMKSAQIAWSEMVNNKLGKHFHIDPLGSVVMFSTLAASKDYFREKFKPMVEATPELRGVLDFKRSSGNTWDFMSSKGGGFVKLVTSNSVSKVKSTSAPLLIVEEPDDANDNVKGQGNTIKLLIERGKTFSNGTVLFGGTPTIKGLSQVESGFDASDQRVFLVPCHHCGESHEMDFEYFLCREFDDGYVHSKFGKYDPETAFYVCPHCGGEWDDHEKNANVLKAANGENKGWFPQERFTGIAGFRFNELVSSFYGSRFKFLKKKQLEAEFEKAQGDETDYIAFVNSSMGKAYEFGGSNLEPDVLRKQALEYDENTVPQGGLILTAGVDVQHDRLAVRIDAWGRGEESWLVLAVEIDGITSQIDSPVWKKLDNVLFEAKKHNSGADLFVSSINIDASDGATSDAVYAYVKPRVKRGVRAIKGSSVDTAPIFKIPSKKTWKTKRRTKAEARGVQIYIVGVSRAKDLIIGTSDKSGRIRLKGEGPARMHTYKDVRDDYYSQMLSEVKAPVRSKRGKMVWQVKSGERNEFLDCAVYSLHAAYAIGVHNLSVAKWDLIEKKLLQPDLFTKKKSEKPVDDEFKAVRKRKPRNRKSFVNRY